MPTSRVTRLQGFRWHLMSSAFAVWTCRPFNSFIGVGKHGPCSPCVTRIEQSSHRVKVLKMTTEATPKHKAAMDDVVKGRFIRKESVFRDWVKQDGSTPFVPELNRYRLYVSLACPWAHRTLITRALKGLDHVLPVTVVHYLMGETGWRFITPDEKDPPPFCEPEPLYNFDRLRQLYFKAEPNYGGRFTVPVLWDTKTETVVNNESSEIIKMLNCEFNDFAENPSVDLYPVEMRDEIDKVAESFYNGFNNGVYRCGFAKTQEAYDEAVKEVFDVLDDLEARLSKSRYLCGSQLTLADVRLFTTLIRFDAVYVFHFKTNKKRIADCPNVSAYMRELYQMPKIRSTVNMEHIRNHYYRSHPSINPFRIVPAGPDLSYLEEPHGRDKM